MAVTPVFHNHDADKWHITVTFTADGDYDFTAPYVEGITLQSDGVDGGGTLSLQVSNDGTNYSNLGVGPVAGGAVVTTFTAAGLWAVQGADIGYHYFRLHLTGSTNPTLVVDLALKRSRPS